MAEKLASGLLMCKLVNSDLWYFLVHPGGPFFAKKDRGSWTIPKGEPEASEGHLDAAQREFQEETGLKPIPPFFELGSIKQKGNKIVDAWTFIGDWNAEDGITCNTFTLEWPPRSGKMAQFPEVDKASWMRYEEAIEKIIAEQIPFLDRAQEIFQPKVNQ
jgi:predicted NUDIX family NTP pyrophosphohydrolase